MFLLTFTLSSFVIKPEVTKPFIKTLRTLLPKLDEASLLLVARVFDPSRQFIKPYLEKSDMFKRARYCTVLLWNYYEITSFTFVHFLDVRIFEEVGIKINSTVLWLYYVNPGGQEEENHQSGVSRGVLNICTWRLLDRY